MFDKNFFFLNLKRLSAGRMVSCVQFVKIFNLKIGWKTSKSVHKSPFQFPTHANLFPIRIPTIFFFWIFGDFFSVSFFHVYKMCINIFLKKKTKLLEKFLHHIFSFTTFHFVHHMDQMFLIRTKTKRILKYHQVAEGFYLHLRIVFVLRDKEHNCSSNCILFGVFFGFLMCTCLVHIWNNFHFIQFGFSLFLKSICVS